MLPFSVRTRTGWLNFCQKAFEPFATKEAAGKTRNSNDGFCVCVGGPWVRASKAFLHHVCAGERGRRRCIVCGCVGGVFAQPGAQQNRGVRQHATGCSWNGMKVRERTMWLSKQNCLSAVGCGLVPALSPHAIGISVRPLSQPSSSLSIVPHDVHNHFPTFSSLLHAGAQQP